VRGRIDFSRQMPGLGVQDLHELNARLSGHQVSGEQTALGKQQLRRAVSGSNSDQVVTVDVAKLLSICSCNCCYLGSEFAGWRGGNKRANKAEQADVDFDWPGDSD